jgi:anthranilate synthase
MAKFSYTTPAGVRVSRSASVIPYARGLTALLNKLDTQRGIYLSSGYEYPGRYSRWDVASICPCLEVIAFQRDFKIRALNQRGQVMVPILATLLQSHPHFESFTADQTLLHGVLKPFPDFFAEEERSRQPSAFSVLRTIVHEFGHPEDGRLGFFGSFGYDLLFQFDPIDLRQQRRAQKDLHLFLCDDVYYMDRKKEQIVRYQYDFALANCSTDGLPRDGEKIAKPRGRLQPTKVTSNHTADEYMGKVEQVRKGMKVGDYYEVVLRRTFETKCTAKPSEIFQKIQKASPSPYEFLLQLGDEQLIGASPEMFVRVEGQRVETCPISGTAQRTGDPMKDADNIRELLSSKKEESELTMCTDVDRNDKSRVCVPGTVKVVGRRLIESYAGVFHTVDHVEGTLEDRYDSLDAFLTHMWAVTVIGAPKKWAAKAIERLEKDEREWYGGAIGMLGMNGDINTGITIRTVHLRDAKARYSVGATLLYDSDPAAEELETRMKATGFFRVFEGESPKRINPISEQVNAGAKLVLIDNDDCFIHTLANYARQSGASVTTYRAGIDFEKIESLQPDLILVSPGPGRPEDFGVPQLVRKAAAAGIPVFGVCLGLQGIVEAFGGKLGVLDYPMHGKPSSVTNTGAGIFAGLPAEFQVGRYHSLYALAEQLPSELEVTAMSSDGVIMGIRHRQLPIEAVQFHPESILSLDHDAGLRLICNAVSLAASRVAK